jgi:hypothetical protein
MTLPKGYKPPEEKPGEGEEETTNPGPIKSKKLLHSTSDRGATIFAVIVVLLIIAGIVAFLFWGYYAMWAEAEEKMDRGCVPTGTANQYGIPTTFSCPRG